MFKTKLAAASLLLIGSVASAPAVDLYDVSLYQAPIPGTYYANQVAPRAANARDSFARAERAPVAVAKSQNTVTKTLADTIIW